MSEKKTKRSFFETPFMSSKIKSSQVSLFPEAALGYLLGPILALICNGVVNIWLIQYWDKVLGLGQWNPLFETLLPIISAILIVVGNIVVGRLMERKPTMAGKARPLILLGMPVIAIALLLLFLVPFPAIGTEGVFTGSETFGQVMVEQGGLIASIFVAVGYNLFYAVAWPLYYTSHSALVNLSTRDEKKRGLLSTAIMGAQLGAAGLSGMAGGLLVDLIGLMPKYELLADVDGLGKVGDTLSDFTKIQELGTLTENVDYKTLITRAEANSKWTILMIVMIACLIVGCLLEYFFTRERITEEVVKNAEAVSTNGEETHKKLSMGEQIKICLKDKYWWIIIVFFFLYQFGGQMKNNAMSFYSEAMTGAYSLSSLINTVGAIPTALGMVIVWPIANKLTKSKTIVLGGIAAFLFGMAAYLPLFVPALDNPTAITVIAIASFCLKALGAAPAMYISLALLANVLDHQEALYGVRTDGFTMSVYGSIMVAMAGVCNGIIVGLKSAIPGDGKFLQTTLAFGVEGIAYIIMAALMISMNVEKFTKADNIVIKREQAAKGLVDKEKEAEEEAKAVAAETKRVEALKAKCEKKGLNFEEENNRYLVSKAEKDAKEAEKTAKALKELEAIIAKVRG